MIPRRSTTAFIKKGVKSPHLEITQKNPDVLGQAFIFSQLKPPLCHHVSWWNPCFLSVSKLHFRTRRRQLHHLLLCRTSLSSHVVHIDLTNCARSATSGWQKNMGSLTILFISLVMYLLIFCKKLYSHKYPYVCFYLCVYVCVYIYICGVREKICVCMVTALTWTYPKVHWGILLL